MDGPARLTEAWEGFFRMWINRMNNHWVFWIDESFWGGENVLQKEVLCGGLLEVWWLLFSVSYNYHSILSCERKKWLRDLNREKVMPTLFFLRKKLHLHVTTLRIFFFFSLLNLHKGKLFHGEDWPSGSTCDGSHPEPGGSSLGYWQHCHPGGKKKGNMVTGNTKCSLRNHSLSTVEKLFDLLTHFIGIGKTT